MRDNMDNIKNPIDEPSAVRPNDIPQAVSQKHAQDLVNKNKEPSSKKNNNDEEYSLNDDRRVKVLSPGALVAKRFFRNSLAVTGLTVLIIMFLFSFLGGAISPYAEDQLFYRTEGQRKDYASVTLNTEYKYKALDAEKFTGTVQAKTVLAIQNEQTEFEYRDITYTLTKLGEDLYDIATDGQLIGMAYKDNINPSSAETEEFGYDFYHAALSAHTLGENAFTVDGTEYTVDTEGVIYQGGTEYAYISRYIVKASMPDVFLTREFRETIIAAIEAGEEVIPFPGEVEAADKNAEISRDLSFVYNAASKVWAVKQETATTVLDTYAAPSWEHPLGTDRSGMDMLTRLMYGGRVSLMIGFIVVAISTIIGVFFGGLAGYFGGWVDNLIMRIVDVFYCIPSTPILIILGATMDAERVDPQIRMIYLMLILGFLSWAGTARLVRGQILSLREQEFMTATEACGIRVSNRIFRHLIPNVIPQLIVTCTMSLGSTIITEATLSFLGLGVRFPFASWGNIINDVNNTYVLTTYWFIWIPAGVCLLLTVLAFNLVGDGLRDAFDPKMKR